MRGRRARDIQAAQGGKVKVLYVAGWGRSGSTILSNILGQIDGFFSAGELCFIWERSLIENRLCGCGSTFGQCETWQAIVREAFGGADKVAAREMLSFYRRGARTPCLPLMMVPLGGRLLAARLGRYRSHLERLYRAIRAVTGARVIVDSSKFASYGYVLGTIPSIGLYVLHLVRDSRAVAYSWRRRKVEQPGRYMPQFGPLGSAVRWNVQNAATQYFWGRSTGRYLLLRYEDFIAHPQESLKGVTGLVGEETEELPFLSGNEVRLGLHHTMSGNPSRFESGVVALREDREWQRHIRPLDRLVVTALTAPWLTAYGYDIW